MELRHLRYFVTVAEELNISRASARLRISQPAISRQIRDLECELGVELLIRDSQGVRLTQAGEGFLAHARDLLRRSSQIAEDMKVFRKHVSERLSIGYIDSVLVAHLTQALRRLKSEDPDIALNLCELSPGDQVEALRAARIDVAFMGNVCPELEKEFDVEVLEKIRFQAVLPDNHRLASQKKIKLSELAGETFIGFDESAFPGRNDILCKAGQAAGFTPLIRDRVDGLSSMLALVAAGRGVAIAPEDAAAIAIPQIKFVRFGASAPELISTVAMRKDEKRPLVRKLLSYCRAAAELYLNK